MKQIKSFQIVTIVVAVSIVGLIACRESGPPVLSLDEAKQVTASFEGRSFTPPPKTIVDIEKLLASQAPIDRSRIEKMRARIKRNPPAGASDAELFLFYRQRAVIAENLGDIPRKMADYRRALRYLDAAPTAIAHMQAQRQLATTQINAGGNFAQGITTLERLTRDSTRFSDQATNNGILARYYVWAGRIRLADESLAKAEIAFEELRSPRDGLLRNMNRARGIVFQEKGLLADAEKAFRIALEKAAATRERTSKGLNEDRLYGRAVNAVAENLALQGRYLEAETMARDGLKDSLQRNGRFAFRTAEHLRVLARTIWAQGRNAEAERLSRDVLRTYTQMGLGDTAGRVIQVRTIVGATLANQGKWREAVAAFDANEAAIARQPAEFRQRTNRWPVYPIALMKSGKIEKSVRVAREMASLNVSSKGAKHYDTAEARGILAMSLVAAGKTETAFKTFKQAIPILLQRSRQSDDSRTTKGERDWRRQIILEAYIDLLGGRGDANSWTEAFRLADVARGQSVQRALSASSARAAVKDPALSDLVRREQDALKQIGALNGLLANAVSVQTDRQELLELRKRIDSLRGARAALAQEIDKRFPDYAAVMTPKPATITQARASLRPGEALIATYVGEKSAYVWAVPRSGKASFAVVPLDRERIALVVRNLRQALDPQAATLGDIPAFDVRLSHRFYRALLEPVRNGWKDAHSLLIVAHGALGQLPFSVLVTEQDRLPAAKSPLFSNYRKVAWLVRNHAVTVLPSVSSLATLRRLPAANPGRRSFAGFGDPLFAATQVAAVSQPQSARALASRGLIAVRGLPVHLRAAPKLAGVSSADLAKLPRLPDTAGEVKGIALAMNADLTRDVFTGKRASEGRVKSMTLAGYKVVAFATHGLVPGDLNGLTQPALALSSPEVTGGKDDGLLTMGEILGLKLDADWVVLSACNTASGNGAGAEAISGLGRAFFYAGTRALLVSNWPVETTSARALTTDIFGRQAKKPSLSRAEALRQSMLGLIDGQGFKDGKGNTVFSYAHPIFWAPFSLVGDGGGGKPAS